jgi:hypothetical protein
MTKRQQVAKERGLRQWSSLTSKQKDKSSKFISGLLADKYPTKYLHPTLWAPLWDVQFTEIMTTKNMTDKICKGYCYNYKGTWIPLTLKDI